MGIGGAPARRRAKSARARPAGRMLPAIFINNYQERLIQRSSPAEVGSAGPLGVRAFLYVCRIFIRVLVANGATGRLTLPPYCTLLLQCCFPRGRASAAIVHLLRERNELRQTGVLARQVGVVPGLVTNGR